MCLSIFQYLETKIAHGPADKLVIKSQIFVLCAPWFRGEMEWLSSTVCLVFAMESNVYQVLFVC